MLYNRLIDVQSPEAYRLDWWEARLHGTCDPAGVVASFASSNAFGGMGYTDREAARVLYSAILNNLNPSDFQLGWWAEGVALVGPVAAAAEMTGSDAFRAACSEYGLGRGRASAQALSLQDGAPVLAEPAGADAAGTEVPEADVDEEPETAAPETEVTEDIEPEVSEPDPVAESDMFVPEQDELVESDDQESAELVACETAESNDASELEDASASTVSEEKAAE